MAQSTTSSIRGHVADTAEAVPGATVILFHEATGLEYHALSDGEGNYHFNNITAGGPYTLRVESLGYRPMVLQEIYAPLSQTAVIDLTLRAESTTLEAVVIHGEGMPQTTGIGTIANRTTIENMPTTNRSLNDIVRLTPQCASFGNNFAVGGGTYRGSYLSVDGASFNNASGIGSNLPAGGSPLSIEAIDQMSINLTPFDVRQSNLQGAAINVVTRHGTNKWHASVYDYFAHDALRGNRIDTNSIVNNHALNNVVGFTVGGPLVKDKLFLFVNAEYTVDDVAGSNRQARPDESDNYGGSTGYNRPTVERMEAMSNFLKSQYNYNPGRYQGYSLSTPDYKVLARLDWHIDANNSMNLRFSHTHNYTSESPSSSMSPLGGTKTTVNIDGTNYTFDRYAQGRTSDYALYYESARYYNEHNFTSVAAEWNSRLFDGKGNNTLRATWSYQHDPRSHFGDYFPTVDILEPYIDANGNKQYALYTTFGIEPFTYNTLCKVHTLIATDEMTYTEGINNITAGVQVEYNHIVNPYMMGGAGWYLFDSWESFANGSNPLSFMITHANLDNPTATANPTFDNTMASLYVQDELSLGAWFTLTAGLRFEVPIIRFPQNNFNQDFADVAAANPNSSFAGLSTADVPNLNLQVSPRVSFRWNMSHDNRYVLRGGTGLFTGRIPNVWLLCAASTSNVLQYQYIANATTGNSVVPFSNDRTTIINSLYGEEGFTRQALAAPTSGTILAKDLRMPTSWKSSLSFDAELPGGITGTLEAIYALQYNQVTTSNLGYCTADSIQLPGEPNRRATYASEGIRNKEGSEMHGYYLHNVSGINGHYLALTAQLAKKFDFGLQLTAAYTHSFSMSVNDGEGDNPNNLAQVSTANSYNNPEVGFSNYVSPNRAIAGGSYTIPEGKCTATRIGLFYEGLNVAYVNTSYSQTRYSYLMSNIDYKNNLCASQLVYIPTREELASMPFGSEANRQAYEEFISNDPYLSSHRGQYSKRNGVIAPWLNRLDLKVVQEFYLTVGGRSTTLEVGVDVNNLLNIFNSRWGTYQKLSSTTILEYKAGTYTFTAPTWSSYNDFYSTWNLLLHIKYSF